MKNYLFETSVSVKEIDDTKWWIDRGLIRNIKISAENIVDALIQYAKITDEKYGVSISATALKNKSPMYVGGKTGETTQCGYVITGRTGFNNGKTGYTDKYIDVWVSIIECISVF